MRRHKVDGIRRGHLRWNDQVAFILAVFIIHENIHPAIARFVDDLLSADESRLAAIVCEEEILELGQSLGCRVPVILSAVAQSVSVEARCPRQTRFGEFARCDQAANLCDDRCAHLSLIAHCNVIARRRELSAMPSAMRDQPWK